MTIEEKQKELDIAKWNKSESLKFDACGSFNYCENCNKSIKNPCAHAYSKFYNEQLEGKEEEIKVAEPPVVTEEPAKKTTRKTITKKVSTEKTDKKKTTTKKACTKKSPTSKKA